MNYNNHNNNDSEMNKTVVLMAAAGVALATSCGPKPVEKTAGINYDYMDTSVKPGDDFASYASGHWIDYNPQPKEYSMWGTTTKVYDENISKLADLIQGIAAVDNKKGSIEQKIGDLYNLMMDMDRLNKEGAAPLLAHLAELDAITTREEFISHCAKEHDNLFFYVSVGADEKDSKNNIVGIGQSGLTLGNKDYYTAEDEQSKHTVECTRQHMKNLFVLCGFPEEVAQAKMERIWEIETQLASKHFSLEECRVPEANYHKMSVEELNNVCAPFDWSAYLKDYRYDRTKVVDLGQIEPVVEGCRLMMELPLEDLKTVYQWRIISGGSSLLSDAFRDENFEYSRNMFGTQEQTPRWKEAVSLVNGLMSDAVGQMFVKKFFPKEAKAEMLELIGNLKASLAERIKAQEWMTDETKAIAIDKLSSFIVKVGYPDKWDDLSGLKVDPSLSLYENVRNASEFYWELNYKKHYEKPVDRTEWLMSPQTVNAYYNPTTNEICFPAGFLQPPMFDLTADAAANYGAVGVVIGHEMTHGFDDQGRQYNKEGNLSPWWTDADAEAFKKPCDAMVEYFNSLWVIPDVIHANGALCLGENIADHGGLNIAYNAFQMWQDKHGRLSDDNGFTPEQRFFLSYANLWAGTTSPELLHYLTMIDVHSVGFLRVNGGLAQCDYWYDAFDIQPGDKYYVAPEDRVRIW